jgi:hypothetical protein
MATVNGEEEDTECVFGIIIVIIFLNLFVLKYFFYNFRLF